MDRQRPCWAALVLYGTVLVLSLSACSKTSKWKQYISAPGKFTVSMPGTPKEETKALSIPGGTLEVKMTQLEKPQEAYLVAFMDFPKNAKLSPSVQTLLATMIKGGVTQSIQGTVKSEKESSLNGVPCREFQATGKHKSKEARMSGKFCLQGQRLYQVFVIGEDTGKAFIAKGDQFLASFQITNQP